MTATAGSASPCRRGRVLLVTSSFPRWPGDSSTPFILHLAQDLQALGWCVQVLAPHAPGAARSEHIDGVAVERFRYLWPASAQTVCYDGGALLKLRSNPLNLLKVPALVAAEMVKIAQLLRGSRYDLVHSHWILPQGFAAGLVARILGVPHVESVHGGDVFALRGRLMTACKRLALRLADAVTVNSSATLQAVTRIGPGKARVVRIPMGAAAPRPGNDESVRDLRQRHRRGDGPLLVFVGRLIEEKGAADFLDAIALVRRELPEVTGLVVGEGPDRARFEARARELGLEQVVAFAGWIPAAEVGDFLMAADVFVAPSKRSANGWIEAQGLTIVEAMLAGVPVVAAQTGGVMDAIVHGETGLLVPEASPAAIAAAVVELHGDAGLRARLVANARSLAGQHFTRAASARRFSELFDGILQHR